MSEEQQQPTEPPVESDAVADKSRASGRFITSRRLKLAAIVAALLLLATGLGGLISYKTGLIDSFIRGQFVGKMNRLGIDFTADKFQVTVAPLKLVLRNASFINRSNGSKLFAVRSADLYLTISNLWAWQLSRDISIDRTDLDGVEVFVNFDENGNSNFDGLNLVEEESRLNFNYTSNRLELKNGIARFGDLSREIAADAKDIRLTLTPEDGKRFLFDLASTGSDFRYAESTVKDINLEAKGIADPDGAEITGLRLRTPLGESNLKGRVFNWKAPRYEFEIESTVDLTETSNTLPLGATLRGLGNFNGKLSGEGETYKVEGEVSSESLAAANVFLKGLSVDATVNGNGAAYDANGKAVAQLLTFEDFKIDFPQLVGMVRGTGTDFKWVGDLQAAAANTPFGTIGSLFISDAVAELKDKKFSAGIGTARSSTFEAKGFSIDNVRTSDGKVALGDGGVTNVDLGRTEASKFKTKAFELGNVRADRVAIRDVPRRTDVKIDRIAAANARIDKNEFSNLTADGAAVGYENGTTTFTASRMSALEMRADGATIGQIVASNFRVLDVPRETIVSADGLRVAKVRTDAAELGSLNIAGIRLSIRDGRIEGTSDDFNAGDATLARTKELPGGGKVENIRVAKPVFVLEPSGAYRASADMSIGGGTVGSVKLGTARAKVTIDNRQAALKDISAEIMDGKLDGDATIALDDRAKSDISAAFSGLDLGKILALQGGRVVPVEGETSGTVDFSFNGTNFRTATGDIKADISANAGTQVRGMIPVTGRVEATAANGLFDIVVGRLKTDNSEFNATGALDLNGNSSNLAMNLLSSDAREIDRLVRVMNIVPEYESMADEYKAAFAGAVEFKGAMTGDLDDPTLNGTAAVDSLNLRGINVGKLSTDISVSPLATELRNGLLLEPDGGKLEFAVNVPNGGVNNISVDATLTDINTGNILAAFPLDLPDTLLSLRADASGTLRVSGLPKTPEGRADIVARNGSVKGETFDRLEAAAVFSKQRVDLERFDANFGDGNLSAKGFYMIDSTEFDVDMTGKSVPASRIMPFVTSSENMPAIEGDIDLTAKATGRSADSKSFVVNFGGTARSVTLSGNALGDVVFGGRTEESKLIANATATLEGQQQVLAATLDFANPDWPLRAETKFDNTELAPFIGLVRKQTGSVGVTGQATGTIFVEGMLNPVNPQTNEREISADFLKGNANFSMLNFQIGDTPINAVDRVVVRFDMNEVVVDSARFSGGGSNVVISGAKALRDDGINNLNIDGRINLSLLNAVSPNVFFAGFSDVNVRVTGPNTTARLNGVAEMQNAAASAFIGTERVSFDRLKGRVIFTSNQAQIDNLTGLLGGGKFTASGGATINDKLQLQAYRVVIGGTNVTVPLPKNFLTTGDAEIEINGRRSGQLLTSFVVGRISAKRSIYTQNIDLADVIGGRREGSIAQTGDTSAFGDVNLDLTIEGRNALVVRNNLADLTASLSLRITGDIDAPLVEGRVSADTGTLFYRSDRYEVQRAELVSPPNTSGINPVVSLQAETEIRGYQIFVKLNGPLNDTENLSLVVTSNPALPSPDIISLITTGNLSNTEGGIPTLAQSGISTAAEILTDEIINKPITKATDKLFGLNKFQLDPIISGQRNPSARLTVGRQINRNLLVTYATNLSEDQNQVLALEYRVSNRLSLVAQYEQRSLTNVTRNRDNFSFEIRFRKRF